MVGSNKAFVNAKEVAEMLGIGTSKAYTIIRRFNASVFFLDVIETVRLTGSRNNDQRDICARLKKSSIVITILYFVFGYLIS